MFVRPTLPTFPDPDVPIPESRADFRSERLRSGVFALPGVALMAIQGFTTTL
jgi:hypothetical protein